MNIYFDAYGIFFNFDILPSQAVLLNVFIVGCVVKALFGKRLARWWRGDE